MLEYDVNARKRVFLDCFVHRYTMTMLKAGVAICVNLKWIHPSNSHWDKTCIFIF